MADMRVRIPMPGNISSLNVGVAAGIAMFEKLRQEKNR
jgi:TrmH family RNA methyltransferase